MRVDPTLVVPPWWFPDLFDVGYGARWGGSMDFRYVRTVRLIISRN